MAADEIRRRVVDARPAGRLADAVCATLMAGLPQDQATLGAVLAALGEDDAAVALARLAADPEDAEHAPLVALLLSPGPETLRALEPALAHADLDAAGAEQLAQAVAQRLAGRRVLALLPDGSRAELAAPAEGLRAFVRRLRPAATAPAELRGVLARRCGPELGVELPVDLAVELAVLLRHCRLDWTPERVFFLATLLERARPVSAPAPGDDVPGLVAWATGFLDICGQHSDLRRSLAVRRQALLTQLRQAEFLDESLARGSYEILMSQGLRLAHVHGPSIRAELALLERACVLALGLGGEALDPVAVRDLGRAEDAEELLRLLAGPEA